MTWLSNAVRRIGSADAVSWPVFWITLAAGVIGNAVTNAEAPIAVRVIAIGLGQAALWLPLALVGALLRRRTERPRPLVVVGAAVIGLMLRAVVIGAVFATLVGGDEVRWSNRFVGALFNVGLAFVVSAYVVSWLRQRRQQIAELQALKAGLAALVSDVSTEFAHRNEEAVQRVQQVLLAELSALDPDDARHSLDVLQRTAVEVVRPLSHELARSRPGEDRDPRHVVDARASWSDVLDHAATGTPFLPGATAAFLASELLAATVAYPRGAGVFAAVVFAVWGSWRLPMPCSAGPCPGVRAPCACPWWSWLRSRSAPPSR